MKEKITPREILFEKLIVLARMGSIPAISRGDFAVGMTLLNALGIEYTSINKPNFQGIVITAHRREPAGYKNRVNLFCSGSGLEYKRTKVIEGNRREIWL